jgi:hypothetical protein
MTEPFFRGSMADYAKLRASLAIRLQNGARRRGLIQMQVNAGIVPTGPRADFLNENAGKVLELLLAAGKAYTASHPDDAISCQDVLDVLYNARQMFIASLQPFVPGAAEPVALSTNGEDR